MTGTDESEAPKSQPAPESENIANNAIAAVRIVPEAPVIFADVVSSQFYGPSLAKIHFVRHDPDPNAIAPPQPVHVLQLILPVEAFVQTVAFFEHRLKAMVKDRTITQESIDKARAFWQDK